MTIQKPQTFAPDDRAIPFVDQGEGQVVVLLPARGLHIGSLGALASVLEDEDFRVVRVGVRRGATEGVTMHDLAQDVVDVLDHLGISTAWIGGHAFGGAVARTVVLDHPDRAEGTLLLGALGTEPLETEVAQAWDTAFGEPTEAEAADAIRVIAGPSADPVFAWGVFKGARDVAAEAVQSAALAATPVVEWATPPANLPILIIQGTDDRITTPADAERLRAEASNRTSIASIPGGGHLFILTHPGEVGFEVEDYLAWD